MSIEPHEQTPPQTPPGSPSIRQMVIIVVGGAALALGSCALAVNSHSSVGLVWFGAVFVAGLAIGITGVLVIAWDMTWRGATVVAIVTFLLLALAGKACIG